MRGARRTACVWIAVLAAAVPCSSAGPRVESASAADLARGTADGIVVSAAGRLTLAPRLTRSPGGGEAGQVWALAGRADAVFLGTGPDGRILRLAGRTGPAPFAAIAQPLVSALALSPTGELVAGSAPDGLVYRIDSGGRGTVWAETGERYVWALAVTADGRVVAATGERGRILEILATGGSEVLFDTDDAHVVSLLALPDGDLLAGGAGHGLVYRIDAEGHALVLHDDELPEVAALAMADDGSIWAALMAPPETAARRPAVRLRLPDGADVGAADEAVGTLEETSGPTIRGVIEGLPPAPPAPAGRLRGRVVRIGADGEIAEVWRSATEAPFCLAVDSRGRVNFGTGEPARLYRVEADGDVALVATLDEAQATRLGRIAGALYLATSNPVALYRVEDTPADAGVFVSRPFDAGGPARWGAIRWTVAGPPGRIEIYTRTGNSADPDPSWSAWGPALTDPGGSAIVNPDGRFLQWRARQVAGVGEPAELSGVTFHYEPYNRSPRIEGFDVDGPRLRSGPIPVRWSTRDPDGDPLEIEIAYRGSGGGGWVEAGRQAVAASEPGTIVPGSWVWDTEALEEGGYTLRAAVSDAPGHPPGGGRTAAPAAEIAVVVDRTPPRISAAADAAGEIEVRVEDQHSPVRSLELRFEGRLRFTVRPIDGVADSRAERFRFPRPAGPASGWSLRGEDAAGNASESPLGGD